MYVFAADGSLCVWDSAQPSHSSAVCVGVGAGSNYQSTSYNSWLSYYTLLIDLPFIPLNTYFMYQQKLIIITCQTFPLTVFCIIIIKKMKFTKIFYILCLRLCLSVCSYMA